MPFDADDFAAFVDPDMPGYVEATIGGESVPGLFRNSPREGLGFVNANEPALSAAPAALASVSKGATVVINSITYSVVRKVEDGMRLTTLLLEVA